MDKKCQDKCQDKLYKKLKGMNLGMESETLEFKRSTSELEEGVISLSSMLNKHGEKE